MSGRINCKYCVVFFTKKLGHGRGRLKGFFVRLSGLFVRIEIFCCRFCSPSFESFPHSLAEPRAGFPSCFHFYSMHFLPSGTIKSLPRSSPGLFIVPTFIVYGTEKKKEEKRRLFILYSRSYNLLLSSKMGPIFFSISGCSFLFVD